ncbi:MAG: transglycosylase SLT domain-containing protein [Pseudomonadota bacterium]
MLFSKTAFVGLLLFPVVFLSSSNASAGAVYSYEDSTGTVRFSDEPPSVDNYIVRLESEIVAFRTAIRKYSKAELRDLIAKLSQELNVEAPLVEAVVKAESEYDASAISKKGARGLMQLMPETARSFGVVDPTDPTANLTAGIAHLKKLLKRFDGNIDFAVAAYNAGEGAIRKHRGVPPYPETVDYLSKVRKYHAHFAELASRSASIDPARPRVVAE